MIVHDDDRPASIDARRARIGRSFSDDAPV
jgi:hypothetical protein